jgi:hypothetical protein
MGDGRTTTVEIRADLLEALRESYPGRSDREILERLVREYLLRRDARAPQAGSGVSEEQAEHIVCEDPAKMRRELADRQDSDLMLRALAEAPLDDETSVGDDELSLHNATTEYRCGQAMPAACVKRELGFGDPQDTSFASQNL